MVDLTLFEVHLDDASFSANAPFAGAGESDDADEESGSGGLLSRRSKAEKPEAGEAEEAVEAEDGDEEGGISVALPAAIALALLVAVGLALRRLLGGESEPEPVDLDEFATDEDEAEEEV